MAAFLLSFLWFLAAFVNGMLGRKRKLGFWGYFLGSIVLSPLIGLLLVLASDTRKDLPST
ncbi:MAG: hypothetical protein HQL66_12365 [Magnetococcales bacterium]|nr:hypothetical protein [Magnetococcales bacterium]